ncbi:MAG: efflux RND transporter periplasmic adaptor subunit [Acidobacteriota bacterium]
MSKTRLVIILGVVAIVVAAGVVFAPLGRGPKPLEVQTEKVTRREVTQTVKATGRVQPKTEVKISADVSAKITAIHVEEGQHVERGTLLLELDRERYLAALESVQANLRVALSNANVTRENTIKSEKDLQRAREMSRQGLETQAALDTAVASYEGDRARDKAANDQVEQARALLKQAQDDLNKTRIYAPIDGTISRRNKEPGEIALGSQFQEDVILVLSNLSGMEALVEVDENDIVSISLGDAATIEVDALPGKQFRGTVTEIASSAKVSGQNTTEQKTEFEIKVSIDDPNLQLRPGMTATAEVTTDTKQNVIGVPIQSVAVRTIDQLGGDKTRFTPDKDGFVTIAFVVDGNKVTAVPVKTGIQSESHIEVTEGLTEGQEIVTGNYRAISRDLAEGAAVEVNNKPAAGARS